MSTASAKFPRRGEGFLLFFALLLVGFANLGCSNRTKDPQQGPQGLPVKIQAAQSAAVHDTTEYVATLKSRASATIMPEVDGRVTEIYVHSGDRVTAGAALMQIDSSKQQATVNSQEHNRAAQQANLAWAQEQYKRASGLHDAGVVSKQDLDQAKTALDAAQAQLNSIDSQVREQQVQLHYYKVVAPWNGIVGDIPVRVGDRVTPSTPLTTVDKPGSLETYIYVPVERASQLKLGLPVQIVDSTGTVLADSRITFVSPEVDNNTQTVLAKAQIGNGRESLRTSQFIRARIVWGTRQSTVVPVLAVTRIGAQYFVFVAEDQKGMLVAHQKPLRVGDTVGNDYVVLEGIRPGDKIIVSGTQLLVDGMPVIPLA